MTDKLIIEERYIVGEKTFYSKEDAVIKGDFYHA